MATLFAESFEGGADGAAVTTANTAMLAVDPGITFAASPVAGGGGSLSAFMSTSTSTTKDMRGSFPTATSVAYARLYLYLPSLPSATVSVVSARGANVLRADLRISPAGALVIRNGSAIVLTTPDGIIPVGQWVRVEWRLDLAAGAQQVRLFHGANLGGSTASYDTGNRAYSAGTVEILRLGIVSTAIASLYVDAISVSDTTWVGPVGATQASISVAFAGTGTLTATVAALNNSISVDLSSTGTLTASIFGIPVPPPSVIQQFHEWVMFARGLDYAPTVALPILGARFLVKHMGVGKAVASTDYTEDRWDALGPGSGITAWRDGRQEFTGLVAKRQLTWDAKNGRATIQLECEGDEAHLADRLVFPDPLRAADDQTVNNYWTFTGQASAAMRQLISDQAGPSARPDRRVTGLALAGDPGVGVSRKWSALFDSEGSALGTLATISVASGANLGLRMTAAPGALTADITVPRNLAASAVFSADLNNLVGFEYTESVPSVTHALAAGQGDLKARMRRLAVTSDPLALQWRRQRWTYVDRRDTADALDLIAAASDALAEAGPTVSLTLTLTDSDAATYGTDWGLGDRITVYVGLPGQSKPAVVSDVVREVLLEVAADGSETIRPAVGSYDAKAVLPTPTQRQLANVGAQLASIKRK